MIALLAGCARMCPMPDPAPPQIVQVPVPQYLPVPERYTKPLPIPQPSSKTVAECVRVARERKAMLQRCNADRGAVRSGPAEPAKGKDNSP